MAARWASCIARLMKLPAFFAHGKPAIVVGMVCRVNDNGETDGTLGKSLVIEAKEVRALILQGSGEDKIPRNSHQCIEWW